jgi:hypothetical protein
MSIARSIEPEWLDSLPCDDPGAVGSRRDLRRLNQLMLHDRIIARALVRYAVPKPRNIIEIGAGDGAFMLSVAHRLARRWPDVSVTLLDRQDLVSDATYQRFGAVGWKAQAVTADVFDFLVAPTQPRFDIIIANLFLHHFQAQDLIRLFGRLASLASCFVACEPRRAFPALQVSRMLWAAGCNSVTRHDAAVSAKAGFRDQELSHLWPSNQGWELRERPAGFFSHCFAASHVGL